MRIPGFDRQGPGARLVLALGFGLWLAAFAALFLHHTMWRDELQAWQIATASRTPLDLYWNMRHEGHPPLWHLLLWLGTQISADPAVMRAIQAVIAAAIFALVALRAPFTWLEKLLLLSSAFLLFHYTVLARGYGLGVLLLLLAAHLHAARPLLAWLCLGLAANTSPFAALATLALAGGFALESRPPLGRPWPFLALYGALLAVAFLWALPPADTLYGFGWYTQITLVRLVDAWNAFVVAFAPLDWPAARFGGARLHRLVTELTGAPIAFTVLPLAPLLWLLAVLALGERRARIMFIAAAAILGTFFYVVWIGRARHHGTHFDVFICCLWLARTWSPQETGRRAARAATIVLLSLNALGGLLAVQGALERPYSMAETAAGFIRTNYPPDVFLAGYRDSQVSAVAGYLARPVYYPQCDCLATFIRRPPRERLDTLPLDPDSPLWTRLLARLAAEGRTDGVLVLNVEADVDAVESHWPGFTLEPRQAFTGAVIGDERYFVYEMRLERAPP